MIEKIGIISNEFNNIHLFYSPSVTGKNTLKYNYTPIYIRANTDIKQREIYEDYKYYEVAIWSNLT